MKPEFYMNLALNEAWKYQFLTYPNPAVGCVVTDKNGQILSVEAHQKCGNAHAELNAIQSALIKLNPFFKYEFQKCKTPNEIYEFIIKNHNNLLCKANAFVTLEPCNHQGKTPPCAKLLSILGFKKVFIALEEKNKIASGGAEFLKKNGVTVEFGICEKEGKNLLKPFVKWQKGSFKLFKLALSLNGSPFGKIVSGEKSRIYAHKIRSVVDLLVVGGETIRKDKPMLNARLANAKAPDICILSRDKLENFDKNIPLFNVPQRKIFTQIPDEAKFIMFEGGFEFLKAFQNEIDAFLIFSSSSFSYQSNVKMSLEFKPLFKGFLGDDTYGIYEL